MIMKNQMNQFALVVLGLFVGAFVLVGCGGEDAGDSGADTEAGTTAEAGTSESSDASESQSEETGADFAGGDYADMFERLVVAVEGIENEADVKKAEPEIAEVFKQMAAAVKADKTWMDDQGSERVNALNDRLGAHMSELGQKDLKAAMAVSMIFAQHGAEVLQAAGISMMGHKAK